MAILDKQRIDEDWGNFEAMLKSLGMRKLDLAASFEIHDASISRWRHNGVPRYAFAYLTQLTLARGALLVAEMRSERITELEEKFAILEAGFGKLQDRLGAAVVSTILEGE